MTNARKPKLHLHTEQFDGHMHAWCGRGDTALYEGQFNATDRERRCKLCEREQFPHGQPDWHLLQSKAVDAHG